MGQVKLINSIEELKVKLSDPKALVSNLEEEFANLAKSLMTNFQIKKGDNRYWVNEVEFYLFTDDHQDIITYPRRCEAGRWYFHASGVDITFRSSFPDETPETLKLKPFLAKGAVFGGILIREIVLVDDLERRSRTVYVTGDYAVCHAVSVKQRIGKCCVS